LHRPRVFGCEFGRPRVGKRHDLESAHYLIRFARPARDPRPSSAPMCRPGRTSLGRRPFGWTVAGCPKTSDLPTSDRVLRVGPRRSTASSDPCDEGGGVSNEVYEISKSDPCQITSTGNTSRRTAPSCR
jgi:hypothetical protein